MERQVTQETPEQAQIMDIMKCGTRSQPDYEITSNEMYQPGTRLVLPD